MKEDTSQRVFASIGAITSFVDSTLKVPLPDQILAGRYRLIKRVGSGGMGFVFLAEQLGLGIMVAIKFLDPQDARDDASRVARFLREGKVGLEVKHPGAAQLLDMGHNDEGHLFLVFEYIEGQDLRALLLSEGFLQFEEARTIMLRICETLAFAHERGIVHRDIKPENIRVRRDLAGPHVKLLDFGIAKLMKPSAIQLTAEGMLTGTPRYMTPEQITEGVVDARTDIYTVGLVFFELLTGAPAFDGKNLTTILGNQVHQPMPMLSSRDATWNAPELESFLQRACAKQQRERFQSMSEVIVALKGLPVPDRSMQRARASEAITKPTPQVLRSENPTEPSFSKPAEISNGVPKAKRNAITKPLKPQAIPLSALTTRIRDVGPNTDTVEHEPSTSRRAKGLVVGAVLMLFAMAAFWMLK
jgi:serine/threonine protein kinase